MYEVCWLSFKNCGNEWLESLNVLDVRCRNSNYYRWIGEKEFIKCSIEESSVCFRPLGHKQVTADLWMCIVHIVLNSIFVLPQKEIHKHCFHSPRIFLA